MSTSEYAAFYRINPATAAKAFQLLVDDGILVQAARDRDVREPSGAGGAAKRRRERFLDDVVGPMVAEAKLFGIPLREVIRRLEALDAAGDGDERTAWGSRFGGSAAAVRQRDGPGWAFLPDRRRQDRRVAWQEWVGEAESALGAGGLSQGGRGRGTSLPVARA